MFRAKTLLPLLHNQPSLSAVHSISPQPPQISPPSASEPGWPSSGRPSPAPPFLKQRRSGPLGHQSPGSAGQMSSPDPERMQRHHYYSTKINAYAWPHSTRYASGSALSTHKALQWAVYPELDSQAVIVSLFASELVLEVSPSGLHRSGELDHWLRILLMGWMKTSMSILVLLRLMTTNMFWKIQE